MNYHEAPSHEPEPGTNQDERKARRRRRTVGAVAAAAAFGVVVYATATSDDSDDEPTATETTSSDSNENDTNEDGITSDDVDEMVDGLTESTTGEPAYGGHFAYTVTRHETNDTASGSLGTYTADGEYVIVHMSVTNEGIEPDFFHDNDTYLHDDDGRKYARDSEATIALDDGPAGGKLNPEETGEFTLVYDLPDNAEPEQVTVESFKHDEVPVIELEDG